MSETHVLLAAQTHRRMVDPITFARRVTPFVIERNLFATGKPAAPSASVKPARSAEPRQRAGEGRLA